VRGGEEEGEGGEEEGRGGRRGGREGRRRKEGGSTKGAGRREPKTYCLDFFKQVSSLVFQSSQLLQCLDMLAGEVSVRDYILHGRTEGYLQRSF